MGAIRAGHQLSEFTPGTTVARLKIRSAIVLGGVRLLLREQPVEGLPSELFRCGDTESKATPVAVSGVPDVVAIPVEHRVLDAVTPDPDDRETVVMLSLHAVGRARKVSLSQGELATEGRLTLNRSGWTDSFERLRELIELGG